MTDNDRTRLQGAPRRPPRPYPFPQNAHPTTPNTGERSGRPTPTSRHQSDAAFEPQGEWPLPSNVHPRRPSQARRNGPPVPRAPANHERQRPPRTAPRYNDDGHASFAQQHPYDWQYYQADRPEPLHPLRDRTNMNSPHRMPGPPPPYSLAPARQNLSTHPEHQRLDNSRQYGHPPRGKMVNNAPLGPPPTARRGPVDYSSDPAAVKPIHEEAGHNRIRGRVSEDDDERPDSSPRAHRHHQINGSSTTTSAIPFPTTNRTRAFHRPSYSVTVQEEQARRAETEVPAAAALSESDNEGPARQASFGKRSKPNLTVVTSKDSQKNKSNRLEAVAGSQQQPSPPLDKEPQQHPAFRHEADANPGASDEDVWTNQSSDYALMQTTPQIVEPDQDDLPEPDPKRSTATLPQLLQPIVYSSDKGKVEEVAAPPLQTVSNEHLHPDKSSIPPITKKRTSRLSNRLSSRLSALFTTRGISPNKRTSTASQTPSPYSSEKSRHHPSDNDILAVREAESRGSVTSLSDLIRRAGKLATNLERGRTASRLGHSWFLDLSDEKSGRRKSEALAIPAAFDEGPTMEECKETPIIHQDDGMAAKSAARHCCGMPIWAFTLLMVVLAILTTAAVVIPVILLVVKPYQD